MVDEAQGIGNGLTLPAGPLREPLSDALNKCDAIILNGITLPFATDKPVFKAHIEPLNPPETDKKIYPLCRVGPPEKFKETLECHGAQLTGWHAFPDHYKYTDSDIALLVKQQKSKARPLSPRPRTIFACPAAHKDKVEILHVQMVFEAPAAVPIHEIQNDMMKKLRYLIEAAFLYLALGVFYVLGPCGASALGGFIGRTIGPRIRPIRKALTNLRHAMPDKTDDEYATIVRDMWDNLGRVMAEYPHLERDCPPPHRF